MHESQPLGIDLVGEKVETCRVAARLREARYQAHCYRILTDAKHNWNSVGRSLGGERSRGIAGRGDHGDLPGNQISVPVLGLLHGASADCCARTASGHATAPPSSLINERLFSR